ncbi:MAG: metal ABC transporter permease [Parachlamydiaceae bacterium]|nr:metal ABC transporter permease [Parachlamydiaceae bacterium]
MLCEFYHPYQNLNFFQFIFEFFSRLLSFFTGQLSYEHLVSDEIQILVLMGVAISSGLVGTFLILRKMTMLANSLSHTILIGIVLAFVFTQQSQQNDPHSIAPMEAMLIASLITGFLTAFLTEFLTKTGKLQEDASTGIIFTSLFALGIILVTILTKSAHIGIEAVMGNVDALNKDDLYWVYLIVLFNVIFIFLFFKEYVITTFDPNLAFALGFSPFVYNYLLMAQVSTTTITSFRAVGVILVLAFMTGPSLAARLLTHRLKILLLLSVFFGCFCAFIGVALTRHILTVYGMALSTSGVVVSTILVFYLLIVLFTSKQRFLSRKMINLEIAKNDF